ncbi:MAG: ZmpA/ZmpB/ZmpC family metallo-endopeptidase-related protein, partial [Lachnospiraceae bacterium]
MEANQKQKRKRLLSLFSVTGVVIAISVLFLFTSQKKQSNYTDDYGNAANHLYQKDNVISGDGFFQEPKGETSAEDSEADLEAGKKTEGRQTTVASNAQTDQQTKEDKGDSSNVQESPITSPQQGGTSQGGEAASQPGDSQGSGSISKPGESQGSDTPAKPGESQGSDTPAKPGESQGSDTPAKPGESQGSDTPAKPGDSQGSDTPAPPGDSQGSDTPAKPGEGQEGGNTDNPPVNPPTTPAIPIVAQLPPMSNQVNLGWTQGLYGGASDGQPQPSGEGLTMLGMQVRTLSPMGVRFVAQIDRSFQTDLEKKGQVEYGILLIEKDVLGDRELTLDGQYSVEKDTANSEETLPGKGAALRSDNRRFTAALANVALGAYGGTAVTNNTVSPMVVIAKKDLFYDADSRIFTAVLSNISPENYGNNIVARSYAKVLNSSNQVVEIHYSPIVLEGSVESIADEVIRNTSTAVKENVEDQQWLREHIFGEENILPPTQQVSDEVYLNGEESVELYFIDQNNQAQLVDGFEQAQFEGSKYRVKVTTKNGKAVYANIKKLEEREGKVGFWLDLEGYKTYVNAQVLDGAFVFYGEKENGSSRVVPFIRPIQELIDMVSKDLTGNYTLKKDYDASGLSGSTAAILGSFTGTLDGAGHKIYGLSTPLFEKLDGAVVSNLILTEALVVRETENEVGILSKRADSSSISNVHVQGSVKSGKNRIGGLLGVADKNTSIEKSSANVTVQGGNGAVGGLVGAIWDTKIENCYAIGKVHGTLNNESSQGVGGLVGWISQGGVINTSYASASVSTNVSHGGGLIGTIPNNVGFQGTSLSNNISFSTRGNGYKFLGKLTNRIFSMPEIKGNIFIEGGELKSDFTRTDVPGDYSGKIEERSLNEVLLPDFYINSLGFSEEIWDFSPLAKNRTPVLVGIDPGTGALLSHAKSNIPEGGILEDLWTEEGYEQEKEMLYYNLSLLMPYAYTGDVIKTAQKIDAEHVLNKYKIKTVYPVNEQGNRVVTLEQKGAGALTSLYIHFVEEGARPLLLNITFLGTKNDVASYQMDRLPIVYQFAKPVIDTDSAAFQTLLNTAKTYRYNVPGSTEDSTQFIEGRTASLDQNTVRESYKRNYEERVKPNLEECLVAYLSTRSDLPINSNSPVDVSVLEKELLDSGKLLDFLFAYNYVDRWYDVVIGGINLRDVVLFDASVVNEKREGLLEDYSTLLKTGADVRGGRGTNNFYKNYLSEKAELTQGKHDVATFVEYFMAEYAGYSDVNDWIVENFQGLIVEMPAKNPKISYRLWKLLKRNTVFSGQELVLPTLSYKTSRNLYLASFPTSVVYGNLEIYNGYSDTESFREKKKKELVEQLTYLTNTYDNFVNLAENGADSINESRFLIVDTSYKKNHNQDVFKEFYKPLQTIWSLNSGAVAIVFGSGMPTRDYIYYNSNAFIGDEQV